MNLNSILEETVKEEDLLHKKSEEYGKIDRRKTIKSLP